MILYCVLLIVTAFFAYFLGSLDTMLISSFYVFRYNLRRLGRGNAWISNFRRIFGIPGFLKLLAVEVIKDVIPILIGALLLGIKGHPEAGRAFAGFCVVLGRLFPSFYRFKGGPASIALIVAGFALDSSVGAAVLVVIAAAVFVTKYISLGTVIGAAALAVVSIMVVDDRLLIKLALFTAALVLIRHIPSIGRIFTKKEEKLSMKEDLTYKLDS